MISITKAFKQFNATTVLDSVSLNIKKGSILGLAGLSGSGKTTLLRCIQGLETLDSGKIEYKGTVGFIFQDFQLFPHMSVIENIAYALKKILKDPKSNEKSEKILAQLNLTHVAQKYPGQLSGGQKQRVALARSLAMHPDILLCDEPTSGLDIASTKDVEKLLKHVHDMGITLVIASHDLEFLSHIATRIVILKNGTVVADLTPSKWKKSKDALTQYY